MRVEVRGQEIRVYSVVRVRRIASGSVVGVTAIESPYPNPGPPCAACSCARNRSSPAAGCGCERCREMRTTAWISDFGPWW